MGRFVEAVADAAEQTGGLVDGTLLREIETAGYRRDLGRPLAAPARAAARPAPAPGAARAATRAGGASRSTARRGVVRRPPGVALDSGGLAKGLFADVIAGALDVHTGVRGRVRAATCASAAPPVSSGPSPSRARSTAASCTRSALAARRRRDERHRPPQLARRAATRPAHHLLDPATGRAAFTGVVQATAIAPTALEAEIRAKAAVLERPRRRAVVAPRRRRDRRRRRRLRGRSRLAAAHDPDQQRRVAHVRARPRRPRRQPVEPRSPQPRSSR